MHVGHAYRHAHTGSWLHMYAAQADGCTARAAGSACSPSGQPAAQPQLKAKGASPLLSSKGGSAAKPPAQPQAAVTAADLALQLALYEARRCGTCTRYSSKSAGLKTKEQKNRPRWPEGELAAGRVHGQLARKAAIQRTMAGYPKIPRQK